MDQEYALAPIAPWAKEVVERTINFIPFCPHCCFPTPLLEALDAIGAQRVQETVHGCYTAPPERKERLQDYVLCLDAWLAGVEARELAGRSPMNWDRVCTALWQVLGERTECKELLVRRIVHRQRWWLKAVIWDGDRRDVYCRDQYLGDVHDGGDGYGHYGNPPFCDPYFAELKVPEVKQLEARLAAICPDWAWFRDVIQGSWLCAPKAFRFLERVLWCVGKGRRVVATPGFPLSDGDTVPGFLECEDTYRNMADRREWLQAFAAGLRAWLAAAEPASEIAADCHRRLGERSPTKQWLVGLLLRKVELVNPGGAFGSP